MEHDHRKDAGGAVRKILRTSLTRRRGMAGIQIFI
jgi:hypothetical protein